LNQATSIKNNTSACLVTVHLIVTNVVNDNGRIVATFKIRDPIESNKNGGTYLRCCYKNGNL